MTPREIIERAEILSDNLSNLRGIRVGMSNYIHVMKGYQDILNDLIVMVRELSETVDTALVPHPDNLPVDDLRAKGEV